MPVMKLANYCTWMRRYGLARMGTPVTRLSRFPFISLFENLGMMLGPKTVEHLFRPPSIQLVGGTGHPK